MFNNLLTSVFGSRNERLLKQLQKTVIKINALEPAMQALSDEQLKAKTPEFKERIANGESLDKILPEAFAVCREASVRVLGMRHFDTQLIGGMVLHLGKIAEMRTGEGKTLVGTLPVYLNALEGKGVHVVTVNDYLARRDSAWMGKLYTWLGLTVDVVYPGMPHQDKHTAYAADITYATNNEIGFDYLRDNMALAPEDRFQRGLNYAIVDEVDSILIDEARTPLIISGPTDDTPDLYIKVNHVVPRMIRQETEEGEGDYWVDEKQKQVHMSEEGQTNAERYLTEAGIIDPDSGGLYAPVNLQVVHHLMAALRAHGIYQRDVDYIVRDGEVIIVDEFTGRTLAGRRWSEGLHQAVEAKEGVPVQRENQTLASITFQNLFRMYGKLAGMTGTADTEAYEFQSIYGLEVVVIPTHRPVARKDHPDAVFLNRAGKFRAVAREIMEANAKGQPVLVGTTSIEISELLSDELNKAGIHHEVLNAKQHEREATIVAQAGRPGSITIATNMAGRGTDIVLGGSLDAEIADLEAEQGAPIDEATRAKLKAAWQERHDAVKAAGGLHIIGTERHESRRIDNQLRGRSGRQGDPGSSRFYLSLEDNLMRIFASDWVQRVMSKMGLQEDDVIESGMVTKQIANAQRKVEEHNFDIRKNLLEFDDVNNDQRKVIYSQRNDLLEADSIKENIDGIREDVVRDLVEQYVPMNSVHQQWNLESLQRELISDFDLNLDLVNYVEGHSELTADELSDFVVAAMDEQAASRETQYGDDTMRMLERHVMLNVLDQNWKEHLASMDYLRQGIHLRGYAQKQPKQEYKREAFELFTNMLEKVKHDIVSTLSRIRLQSQEEVAQAEAYERELAAAAANRMNFHHDDVGSYSADEEAAQALAMQAGGFAGSGASGFGGAAAGGGRVTGRVTGTLSADDPRLANISRNDPCPCGSGKKYKHCHGSLA